MSSKVEGVYNNIFYNQITNNSSKSIGECACSMDFLTSSTTITWDPLQYA